MAVRSWDVPIKAEWHRATALDALSFGRDGLTLHLIEEDSERRWRLHFPEVQAFRCVTEESAGGLLGSLPTRGAFYEVDDSPWLRELGQGELAYMSQARHYIICCYDEIAEVVATRYTIEQG